MTDPESLSSATDRESGRPMVRSPGIARAARTRRRPAWCCTRPADGRDDQGLREQWFAAWDSWRTAVSLGAALEVPGPGGRSDRGRTGTRTAALGAQARARTRARRDRFTHIRDKRWSSPGMGSTPPGPGSPRSSVRTGGRAGGCRSVPSAAPPATRSPRRNGPLPEPRSPVIDLANIPGLNQSCRRVNHSKRVRKKWFPVHIRVKSSRSPVRQSR
jgi:hypothetical protein